MAEPQRPPPSLSITTIRWKQDAMLMARLSPVPVVAVLTQRLRR